MTEEDYHTSAVVVGAYIQVYDPGPGFHLFHLVHHGGQIVRFLQALRSRQSQLESYRYEQRSRGS
jgi:hypothetical protein